MIDFIAVIVRVVFTFGILASIAPVLAAIPPVPPEIIAQLKTMTPAEQRALAAEYGFDLEVVLGDIGVDTGSFPVRPSLGAPGDPLEPEAGEVLGTEMVADESDEEEDVLERFGADLFDTEVSTFAPVDNIPVPEGYRLGVGDTLQVLLIGKEQGEFPLLIDRDGSVSLPKLGRVVLSGLTFPEAKALIERRVSEQLIGSEAILSMGSLRSINVFIAGEVRRPGNYSVSALSTLSQAVYVAGGISDMGTFRSVQLRRQGETIKSFDIYDLLLFGDNSGDARLQNGDVVFVPLAGTLASVVGAATRPAIYELVAGDTLEDLLDMAGGTLATANSRQALIKRYKASSSLPSIENVDLTSAESLRLQVIDGDTLTVPEKVDRASNPISVEGDTGLPELIGWEEGLTISDIFVDLDSDVNPTADLNLSLVVRKKNSRNDISVLPFSCRSC